MIQINLLPWREQERSKKRLQFFTTLGIFIGITLFILVLVHLYLDYLISNQNKRINYLQTVLGEKQAEFFKLKDQQKKQNTIQTELTFLNGLRENSYQAIRLLNELVKVVPPTITLEKITRTGNKITLIGNAQSELQITLFMKNITQSAFFNQPTLTRLVAPEVPNEEGRVFQLDIQQKENLPS